MCAQQAFPSSSASATAVVRISACPGSRWADRQAQRAEIGQPRQRIHICVGGIAAVRMVFSSSKDFAAVLTCCPAMVTLGASDSAAPPPPPAGSRWHPKIRRRTGNGPPAGRQGPSKWRCPAIPSSRCPSGRRAQGCPRRPAAPAPPGQKARQGGVKTGTAQEYTSVYGPWRPRRMYCSLGA